MRTIAIETSSDVGSVACVQDARPLRERVFRKGLTRGKDIIVELAECLREVGWDRHDIELIAVSIGPGSYTGLRVGIAAAKGLTYALRVPVIGVCSLDAIAENGPRTADHVAVVLDARREQVYAAYYVNVGFSFFREDGPLLVDPAEFARRLPSPVYVMGDGLNKYRQQYTAAGMEILPEVQWHPKAMNLGLLGEKMYLIGERTDPAALAPLYLRVPEAEEKWQARQAAGEPKQG